jgi:phosphomevalonate kinase
MTLVATAPGKLILTGEYAVLDGAPAVVIAVNRRVIARMRDILPAGSSPFLLAVASALAERDNEVAARAALDIVVDSSALFDRGQKLGLGSSAAVTVAAAALALSEAEMFEPAEVLAVATAAHAAAQSERGARGSGADIASAVHGGTIAFTSGRVEKRRWPAAIRLVPFFTGAAADTATLVARVQEARAARPVDVEAALTAIADASSAADGALRSRVAGIEVALLGALSLAGAAIDRLAIATGVELVPRCVTAARSAMQRFGGTAKTTGAGGGDVGIAAVPATSDEAAVRAALVGAGCQILDLSLDEQGVDLRPVAS